MKDNQTTETQELETASRELFELLSAIAGFGEMPEALKSYLLENEVAAPTGLADKQTPQEADPQ